MAKNPQSPRLNKSDRSRDEKSQTPDEPVRLNKWLSECGIASRRKADELIGEGAVLVNGKKVFELGTKVYPGRDRITVNGKPIKPPTHKVYILFNKPKNVVTTMEDPEGRPSISDFFERLPVRVFPVGRLDWDTEGMILLTNDGEFAQKVNHPSAEILKTYMVKISGRPSDEQLARLRTGVSIIGGRVSARHVERIRRGGSEQYDWIKIMIAEGKNRQVRRMFEKIGFDVMKLQRIAIGKLRMPGALKRGEYLLLTPKGLEKIFEGAGEAPTFAKDKEKVRQRSAKTDSRAAASRAAAPSRSGKSSGARKPDRKTDRAGERMTDQRTSPKAGQKRDQNSEGKAPSSGRKTYRL